MEKDFDGWNEIKKQTNVQERVLFFHEREVWWCRLGINIGTEQDGVGDQFYRPIVIMRGFNTKLLFGVMLTGRKRSGKYYFYLQKIAGRESSAILSQVRVIDTKRLIRKIGTLDETTFLNLKNNLQGILFH